MTERYKLDIRTGCVAIVDTFNPYNSGNGLHRSNPNVVRYMSFTFAGGPCANIDGEIAVFKKECAELNAKNTLTKEQINDAIGEYNDMMERLRDMFPHSNIFPEETRNTDY